MGKKLKELLVLIEGNKKAIENSVAKFSYTYNIAKEMVDVYKYVIDVLKENDIAFPNNLREIEISENEDDYKDVFEIVSYRSDVLVSIIKNELTIDRDEDVFDNLDKFEKDENRRIAGKIRILESEIEENYENISVCENNLYDLEKELETIISDARDRDCSQDEAFKVAANVNLDIEKLKLKIEKTEREIDKCYVAISRKRNEISILEFKIKK